MSIPAVVFGSPVTSNIFGVTGTVEVDAGLGRVHVPHGDFLLSAEYARVGPHLSLSEGETSVLVKNFFTFKTVPDLLTEDGSSIIDGALAIRLAGPLAPGQFAQAGQLSQVSGMPSIGTVEKLAGTVTLTRSDGTVVQASKGSAVFTGDIIKTEADANIGIKFVDETNFALGGSGRMVIDEMIYDPSANSNSSSSFSVVKGVFSFVSGQIAKAGDDAMVVKTPVATIGIRGTTVAGKAAAEGSTNSITLLPDADGGVGQIAVSNSAGTQVMSVPFQTTSLSSAFTAPPPPMVIPANQLNNLYGNIKTVLPPTPGQQQQQQQEDTTTGPASDADGEPSGESEQEEAAGEGESPEGEAEPEDGEEGDQEEEGQEGQEGEQEQGRGEAGDAERPPSEAGPEEGEGPEQDAGDVREREASEKKVREGELEAVIEKENEREIAEEAFNQAIEEGADPREAAFRAERAVQDSKIEKTSEALVEGTKESGSAEEALNRQLQGEVSNYEDVDIISQAAFRSLNEGLSGQDNESFTIIVKETVRNDKVGEGAFRDVLIEGGNINDAFAAAFRANIAAGEDFISANLFVQGFDPGLQASARINQQINEVRVDTQIARGTISTFTEQLFGTAGNDVLTGSPGSAVNSTFITSQGSTLGGTDTINGGGGTDELSIRNLSDILFVATAPSTSQLVLNYSDQSGTISGKITANDVEQALVVAADGTSQRISAANVIGGNTSFVIVGTSGNDTLNLRGDGTSAVDVVRGSLGFDSDAANARGNIVFGQGGDDTITTAGSFTNIISAGDGDDVINLGVGAHLIEGDAGDDTIVVEAETSFFFLGGRIAVNFFANNMSGGTNSSVGSGGGDILQIGNSATPTNQTFTAQANDGGANATIVGMEILNFFKSGTTFRAFADTFLQFSSITGESGVTGVELVGTNGTLNLSAINIGSAVSTLSAVGSGVRVFDGTDGNGRTLVGTANNDTLSGFGGNDIFQMGGGRDTLSGGDGDDTFQIAAASDITSGVDLSGGAGTDTLSLTSTSISALDFSLNDVQFATLESFNLSGGAASGVAVTMRGNFLDTIPQFVGDGTTDVINVFTDDFDARGLTFNGIEQINLTETISSNSSDPGTFQEMKFNSSTSITGLDVISGTADTNGDLEDEIDLSGSRDFSGITFTNIDKVQLQDGSGTRQTIGADASTSLGLTEIEGFTGGSGSTTDRFDYKSNLVSGDGTTVSAANDFTLTEINSGARATNVISANSTGVIDFETTVSTNNLGIDITNSSLSQITTAVEALLESTDASTNLSGSSAQVTQGAANTDSLLIFYDNDDDAVIIRYQEGATSEADFSGELSVLAIFDNPGGVSTFDDVNII